MYSVAVLGDVRTHFIFEKGSKNVSVRPLRGGAYFTSALISEALAGIAAKPNIFACEIPPVPRGSQETSLTLKSGDEMYWEVKEVELNLQNLLPHERKRLRLTRTGGEEDLEWLPRLSSKFAEALKEGGTFANEPKRSPAAPKRVQLKFWQAPDILVLHDLDTLIRRCPLNTKPCYEHFAAFAAGHPERKRALALVRALTALFGRLSEARKFAEHNHHFDQMEPLVICTVRGELETLFPDPDNYINFWTHLLSDKWLCARTVVLLDAKDLRISHVPLAVSTALSWERTAQDTIFELRRNPQYRRLLDFAHVIIRYGVTGALHISRHTTNDWSYTLHFDPAFDDTTWTETSTDGAVPGNSSVFVASLVKGLTRYCSDQQKGQPPLSDLPKAISDSLRTALLHCQRFSHFSYGRDWNDTKRLSERNYIPTNLFLDSGDISTITPFAMQSINVPPVLLRTWSILSQSVQVRIGHIARQIVKCGVDSVLNQNPEPPYEPAVAPVVKFGDYDPSKGPKSDTRMIVVDRSEIEGFRAIQKLMRAHVAGVGTKTNLRPLSVAVFGPPGAGKSYAVKQIIKGLGVPRDQLVLIDPPYNLAQFTNVNDLNNAFEEIDRRSEDDKVPIAFFDEFDSRFGQEELGWLKLFLAPMEDGEFNKKNVKNAILVFAGGTAATFSEFSLQNRSTSDPQWQDYCRAKGPDFISRLGGHLNIVGINPADADDELYLVRRAILIRAFLQRMQTLSGTEIAQIDDHMLRAVLHVPEYRHGGRAVRMLLQLCKDSEGRISLSAVPPIQQLNMLVDGQAFLDLAMNVARDHDSDGRS